MAEAHRPNERPKRLDSLTGVPVPSESVSAVRDDDELAKKLLVVAAIRVTVVTLALGVLFALVQLRPPGNSAEIQEWQYTLIGITYGLSIVYAAALRYQRLVRPLAYAQIGLDSLIVSVLVLMTGGVESIFGFAYVFPVLGASVALYRRGGLVAAVVTILMYGTIVSAQLTRFVGVLPVVIVPANALLSYALHSAGMALVAVLSSTLAEKAKKTGQALAETQLDYEQLQELHAAILRSLPAGLLTIDETATIRYANEAAINILRVGSSELLGRPLQAVAPGMRLTWERWRSDPLLGRERHEHAYEHKDGSRARLGYSFAPLSLSMGGTMGSIVVFQDVTDIVRLKETVERSRRLATVGKFAAGLAHEVRNPLASMCASIDVLAATLTPPESMQRLMSNVVEEADRLNRLITDFLALARPRALQMSKHDLSSVVGSILEVFANDAVVKEAKLASDLEPGVDAVFDEDLIRQVVWNLLRNAAEALEGKGTLQVLVRTEQGRPVLEVKDDGPGMSQEQLSRVFDPFYTTKVGGSGLGLAISHSIVEAHGAQMNIDSTEGSGTSVSIHFRDVSESAEIDTSDLVDDGSDDVELLSGTV